MLAKTYKVGKPGLYKATFFNDYSWVRSKIVIMRVEVFVPGSAPPQADGLYPTTLDDFNTKYISLYH